MKTILSEDYINQAFQEIQSRLSYPLSKKDEHDAIYYLGENNKPITFGENVSEIVKGRLYLKVTQPNKQSSRSKKQELGLVYQADLEELNQLDDYTLQLLKWLKNSKVKQHYTIIFSDKSHIYYITHYIENLKKWLLAEEFEAKLFLIVPETIRNLYASSFSNYFKTQNTDIQNEQPNLAEKWQQFGFTEKAILITTCFLNGLNLHQFRQVISAILKVKDQQEEKVKSDRKMQGFYIAKWEKNYDQILRNCRLKTIKNEDQPAFIGFENLNEQLIYTQFIKEEYPIFLQEFFEILIHAVFPKLCEDYQEVLRACIAMYASLASHHKNYSNNLRPVELMVSLLNKSADPQNKERLSAQLISELCLHEPIAHLASHAFELLSQESNQKIHFLNTIVKHSQGQALNFCLSYWIEFLESDKESIQKDAFTSLLNYSLHNTAQLSIIIERLIKEQISISFTNKEALTIQAPLYETFLLYYSVENLKQQTISNLPKELPTNLLLVQDLSFNHYKIGCLPILLENLFKLPSFFLENKQHLTIVALLSAEWYIAIQTSIPESTQVFFKNENTRLLELILRMPFLSKNFNRKRLINQWQEITHKLLLLAKEIPHVEHQQLMALNTKRKIMLKLINNFRNL